MMAEDPKKLLVEIVGRLGRETQLHLDERHHHFHITNLVLMVVSLLLVILAVVNVYYIRVLYQDLSGIVNNMDSMHSHMKIVNTSMISITDRVEAIDRHVASMEQVTADTVALAGNMSRVRYSMDNIAGEMGVIQQDMGLVRNGMLGIENRLGHMTNGVNVIGENVRQIARPMGMMNPMMP